MVSAVNVPPAKLPATASVFARTSACGHGLCVLRNAGRRVVSPRWIAMPNMTGVSGHDSGNQPHQHR